MSIETMIETAAIAGIPSRSLLNSPHRKSPSPPSTNTLASHLLAAVSQVQNLTSQLPPSVQLPSGSPPLGGNAYRPVGLLGTNLPQLHLGAEPPMSSLLAGLKDFPRPYHSPPPLPSTENHECKIVEYRGSKVAAFIIGDTMLCLPQAFEIFLKHLVGGLHTVYTKLKRLGIEPLVCNVDQVRILRGLGAIQPGVNRCKLLSVKHFDLLYRDCTTASSRPGRPPKRASDFMSMATSPESIFEMKKRHLESNGSIGFNGHIGSDMRLDKSPLLANGYHAPPHFNPLQYMANHMAGLYPPFLASGIPGGVPGTPGTIPHPISPPESSPMKHITPESLARLHEERIERERQMILDVRRSLPHTSIPSSICLTPTHPSLSHHNITSVPPTSNPTSYDDHQPPASPILNLSKGVISDVINSNDRDDDRNGDHMSQNSSRNEENRLSSTTPLTNVNQVTNHNSSNLSSSGIGRDEDRNSDMDDDDLDKDELAMDTGDMWSINSSTPGQTQLTPPPPTGNTSHNAPLSSTEVLLRNILGLLRVAEENARHHERQTQYEKAELKMEVLRERELRETLEKQLLEEQKNRVLMQKRCAKLKKLRRRLQERLDIEVKRRSRYEDHLRSASPEVLSDINGSLRKDMEAIATELHQDTLQQREDECNKVNTEVLMSSSPISALPVLTASSIATSNWR